MESWRLCCGPASRVTGWRLRGSRYRWLGDYLVRRTSSQGWHTQHLVSTACPVASRAVMSAGQSVRIADGSDVSQQNGFRCSNRFATSVFGTFTDIVSSEQAALIHDQLLSVPLNRPVDPAAAPAAVPVTHGENGGAGRRLRWAHPRCRVHRRRGAPMSRHPTGDVDAPTGWSVYAATDESSSSRMLHQPLGVAVRYRGPLGFNFGFLENRRDLVLKPGMGNDQAIRGRFPAGGRAAGDDDISMDTSPWSPIRHRPQRSSNTAGTAGPVVLSSIWPKSAFEPGIDHVDKPTAAASAPVGADDRHRLLHGRSLRVGTPGRRRRPQRLGLGRSSHPSRRARADSAPTSPTGCRCRLRTLHAAERGRPAHLDVRGVGIDISRDRFADARHNGRMHAVAAHARNSRCYRFIRSRYSRMLLETRHGPT